MKKLLILLVFVSAVLGLQNTMNNALRNQVVTDLKNALVPIISKKIENIYLDDMKGKTKGVKYEIRKIHINIDPISPAQINIQFLNGSILRLSGNAFSMKGSAKGRVKFAFISTHFNVKIYVNKFSFAIGIQLSSVNNKPNIAVKELKLDMSQRHVHVKISGGLLAKIIDILVKLMKGSIVHSVVKAIRKSLPVEVTKVVNQILNGLPTDIKITDQVFMKYQFPVAPQVRDGYLLTGIVAYLHPFNDASPPPGSISPMPLFDVNNPKGIQFFMSDFVIRSAINTIFKLKLMNVIVKKKISNREVIMTCTVNNLPELIFANAIEANATGTCNVALDNDTRPKFQVSASIHLRLSERVNRAVLYFKIEELRFAQLTFKVLTPVDIEWFKKAINQVFDAIKEVVNLLLGQRGIPLPVVKEVDYSDFVQYIGKGYIMLGTNPIFHFTKANETLAERPAEEMVRGWELARSE